MANDAAKNPIDNRKTSRVTSSAGVATRPTTRNETRKTGATVTPPVENIEISSASEGRRFLEEKLLLCPPNEEFTLTSLIACLHQVSRMGGIPKTVATAVLSATYLAEELEETSINAFVRDAVNSQLGELTIDVKALITDAKDKIDEHIQNISAVRESGANKQEGRGGRTYADTLINPPPHANPRLAAREGIKARQFMLEGPERDSKIGQMNGTQLKEEFNKKLESMGQKDRKIRSAIVQRHRGILIELETDDGANWMRNKDNRAALCEAIGSGASFKPRTFNLIAFNVALTVDPGSKTHLDEICEVNHLNTEAVSAMRWAKLPERRKEGQKTAHLIIAFNDANTANRAISEGLMICNRKVHVEKVKKDPIRCLKCQGWNHYAKECILTHDRCGNCAEEHRTDQCPHPQQLRCISCNTDDHASWSRGCPTYLKKIEDNNRRNPENDLQFIPTEEPWTWTARPEANPRRLVTDTYLPRYGTRQGSDLRTGQEPPPSHAKRGTNEDRRWDASPHWQEQNWVDPNPAWGLPPSSEHQQQPQNSQRPPQNPVVNA